MIKNCVICGKEFNCKNTAKTCSVECSKKLKLQNSYKYSARNVELLKEKRKERYQKKPKPIRLGICAICGKEFVRFHNQKLCSEECAKKSLRRYQNQYMEKFRKEKREQNEYVKLICIVCNKEFVRLRSSKEKICSDECRKVKKIESYTKYRKPKFQLNPEVNMSYNLEKLQIRASKLEWNIKKSDIGKYIVWKPHNEVKYMRKLDDIALFLRELEGKNKINSPKVKKTYTRKFSEMDRMTAKLGYTLYKEDWWDAMGKRKYYKIVKNGEDDKLFRFITLNEIEDWCKSDNE